MPRPHNCDQLAHSEDWIPAPARQIARFRINAYYTSRAEALGTSVFDSMHSAGLSVSSQFLPLSDPWGIGLHGIHFPDSQSIRLDTHAGFEIQCITRGAI